VKKDPYGLGQLDEPLLEAEISLKKQADFERDYLRATNLKVQPGFPPEYMLQKNKWGRELRLYFNSPVVAAYMRAVRIKVEQEKGYKLQYKFRVNSGDVWWELVRKYGFRLGKNP
jgi:hypothetical protein